MTHERCHSLAARWNTYNMSQPKGKNKKERQREKERCHSLSARWNTYLHTTPNDTWKRCHSLSARWNTYHCTLSDLNKNKTEGKEKLTRSHSLAARWNTYQSTPNDTGKDATASRHDETPKPVQLEPHERRDEGQGDGLQYQEVRGEGRRMHGSQRTSMPRQLEPSSHHTASTLINNW